MVKSYTLGHQAIAKNNNERHVILSRFGNARKVNTYVPKRIVKIDTPSAEKLFEVDEPAEPKPATKKENIKIERKDPTTMKQHKTPLYVKVINWSSLSLWLPLALLALRCFAPEIEREIPGIYKFLDTVVVPPINWIYALATKGINWLLNLGFVQTIIEFLSNLAA